MPGSPQSNAPPWNEADSVRETTLICIDDPEDQEALRKVGRLLYHLALEATRGAPGEESETRRELRAAAADLRYLEGFFLMVERQAEDSSLPADDIALTRIAAKLARKVGDLAARIEGKL
jgi:hypothetical protein